MNHMKPFAAGANPSESWRFWKQDFEDFMEASGYSGESEKKKTAIFRHVCGDELKTIYRTMTLQPVAPATEVTLQQILAEFDRQYEEYQHEIYASFLFLEIKQKQGEKFQDFFSRLKLAIEDCKYDNPERMLRDKIVQGLQDKPLQERLLRETSKRSKTLQDVVSECRAAEQSRSQATAMSERTEVNAVTRTKQDPNQAKKNDACRNCGRRHEPRKCPAYGTTCKNCGKKKSLG